MITVILLTIISVCLIYGMVVLLVEIGKFSVKALLTMIAVLIIPFTTNKDEEHPVAWKIVKTLWCILLLLLVFIIVMEATH